MGYQKWGESNFYWSGRIPTIQLKWDEAIQTSQIVVDAIEANPGKDVITVIDSLPETDRKKFIDLVVTFKNITSVSQQIASVLCEKGTWGNAVNLISHLD